VREPLLVAQLDAAEVQHAVLHRRQHALATAGALALVERAHDAQRQVQAAPPPVKKSESKQIPM
jgi:hypothetical protein